MFVVKKSSLVIISVVLLTVITFFITFSAISRVGIGEASSTGIKVVLDAGHGGVDGGVSGVKTNVKESELNLKIVKKLEKFFKDAGVTVVLTRSSDAGLYGLATSNLKKKDMQKRKEIIENASPDLVISVHLNRFSSSNRRGAQVFYNKDSSSSKLLATNIQSSLNLLNKHTKEYSALAGDYYILKCSAYPSVIAECGFLSNPEDESLLITDEYQDSVAYAIFRGAIDYLVDTTGHVFEK